MPCLRHRPAGAFLAPLADALCAAKNPASGHEWLRSPAVRDRLQALACGHLPLTHEALSALPPSGGVNHLRELLMAVGLLPARNAELVKFEQWSAAQLDRIQPKEDRQALATYIAWHHHRRLARQLADGTSNHPPGAPPANRSARPSPSWPGSGSGAPLWPAATSTTLTHGSPTARAPEPPPGASSPSPSNGASAHPCASPFPSTASRTPCPTTSASPCSAACLPTTPFRPSTASLGCWCCSMRSRPHGSAACWSTPSPAPTSR